MTAAPSEDRALLAQVQRGDEQALAELYDRYSPLLYSVALRILRRPADAEDAVQDAWLQVWRLAASYDPARGALAAWLLTVVRTRALDRLRGLTTRGRAEARVEPEGHVAPIEDPAKRAGERQMGGRVREALAQLSDSQRQVLEIAYFEGLPQSEIAARVGAPLGTVKSWTRQGLQKLRELLPQEEWV